MDQIKIICPKCKKSFSSNEELKKILRDKEQKYREELKVKEKLAIEIKQIVEKNKASFAFPSQSIYVEKK